MSAPRASFGLSVVHNWAYIVGGMEEGNNQSHSGEKINLLSGEIVALPFLKNTCQALFRLKH